MTFGRKLVIHNDADRDANARLLKRRKMEIEIQELQEELDAWGLSEIEIPATRTDEEILNDVDKG